MIIGLGDDRRDKKPWLPADARDVTGGLVVPDAWGGCSEFCCGAGAEVVDTITVML